MNAHAMTRRAVLAAPAILAWPALAADEVDVLLVLAADVSLSMTMDSLRLQREAYAAALSDPGVIDVIRSGPHGRIGLAYVEWSAERDQRLVVPWTIVQRRADVAPVLERLAAAPMGGGGQTALGAAVLYGLRLIDAAPWRAVRRVIDVSGDGATNDGPGSSVARDAAIRVGVTVNGLPIVTPAEPSVATHYQEHVIGGPGAFMIEAHGIADVTQALRRKLLIELASAGEGRVG